jgi:hypothetical protein
MIKFHALLSIVINAFCGVCGMDDWDLDFRVLESGHRGERSISLANTALGQIFSSSILCCYSYLPGGLVFRIVHTQIF